MPKPQKPDETVPAADVPKKASITDMLTSLNEAFEVAEAKKEALAQAHQAQAKAVEAAQAKFDAVKADYQSRVQAAAQEADAARQALETLRAAVNERVGTLIGQPTDPRVSVR